MESPSLPRKRGSEDQLDKQAEKSGLQNAKRSKASLESILEPIPADRPDYAVNLHEQQNNELSSMNSQPRREREEGSSTITRESIVRRGSQTEVNPSIGQTPFNNAQNTFTVPISIRQEDQGVPLAGEPGPRLVGMYHNLTPKQVESHNYQMQLMLVDRQNQKRKLLARQEQEHYEAELRAEKQEREDQDAALRTINSLPDQLSIAHASVKDLLQNLLTYFQKIEKFKHSIPADIKTLQGHEEEIAKKEGENRAWENTYDELIQSAPEDHREEMRNIQNKTMRTMRQYQEKLRLERDNTMGEVEEKNQKIAELEVALVRTGELVPELIGDLTKLAAKLGDVRKIHSSASIRTVGESGAED